MRGSKVAVIFGLKVHRLRAERGYGLKELSSRAGLSPSYLTEIEKGRKYPKADKVMQLADALDTTYDELVSLKLGDDLDPLESLLDSPLVEVLPLGMFGLAPSDIVDLITRAPHEASAFIRTLADIAGSYDVHVEHFLYSMLRSYQETHDNYFPDIESAVARFAEGHGWNSAPLVPYDALVEALEADFGITVEEDGLAPYPDLSGFRSVWIAGARQRLLLNPKLSQRQKAFQIGREIGYRDLKLKERGVTSSRAEAGSFEQVLNDFKASYYAGALLIPQDELTRDLTGFFARDAWDGQLFLAMMNRYGVTPEMFLYRLTQIVPKRFGLKQFHFLRVSHDVATGRFQITKHFKMSGLLMPLGQGWHEHYCRRWLAVALLNTLGGNDTAGSEAPVIAAQRSQLIGRDASYFVITLARPLALTPGTHTSVTLGFQITPEFESVVRFCNDPAVPSLEINETCERCPLSPEECHERVAPPILHDQKIAQDERNQALAQLLAEH